MTLAAARLAQWLKRTVPTCVLLVLAISAGALVPDANRAEQIPALRPPRPEIPPGFWEQYGGWVVAGTVVALLMVSLLILWLKRPRAVVPIPPEVQARQELAPLRNQPETGAVLSRVSQILRRYVSHAFQLSQGELTTTDLVRAMQAKNEVGAGLANSIGEFLRVCDERKFAPAAQAPPLNAAMEAEQLVESVEARRAELRVAAAQNPAAKTS